MTVSTHYKTLAGQCRLSDSLGVYIASLVCVCVCGGGGGGGGGGGYCCMHVMPLIYSISMLILMRAHVGE